MTNLVSALWDVAAREPHRVALRSGEEFWTYDRLREGTARWAGLVASRGITPGDRVLLIAPSVPEFVVAYYGLHAAGAVVITMNVMATGPEIDHVIADAGASLVIAWHADADAARAAAERHDLQFVLLASGAPATAERVDTYVDRAPDDTAVILYTSGTTGRPKGAELMVSNLDGCAEAFREVLGTTSDDRYATALPLFHVYGQAVVMHTALTTGCSLTLQSPFDPVGMIDILRNQRITISCGVPTMWNALLHAPGDHGPADFGALRLAASGGASLPTEVMRAFGERFDCVILEGYGLTETTGAATFNGLDRDRKVGAVGIALPGSAIEVRGPGGVTVPPGEVGEVYVSGTTVMKGYRNRPEANAESLVDGWLRTGDLGTLDEDGDLRIVDRVKDLIIRGGYNVYPREVEEVLYEHPDIIEVAVVGVPDDHYGEEVAAVVSLAPGSSLDAGTLRPWAKERLSAYKVPRIYRFVEELPKGATGKILKRAIDRDQMVAEGGRA